MALIEQTPLSDEEQQQIRTPDQFMADTLAAKIAFHDFKEAEQFRSQNHDHRWRNADQLYLGWQQKRTWRGTRVPRSNLGIFLVFQQIESFLPRAMSALFSADPWFEALALPRTPKESAQIAQDVIVAQLEQCNFHSEAQMACKDALTYGNGILELEWVHREIKKKKPRPKWVQKKRRITGFNGESVMVPTGEIARSIVTKTVTEIDNRPRVKRVSLADFYIDPNCPTPNVQDARFVVKRSLLAIDEVLAFQGKDDFNVPGKQMLLQMSKHKGIAESDTTKQHHEVARQNSYDPRKDYTHDPAGQRVEILKHWTRDRCVWLIRNGEELWPLLNMPNPQGFIPYYNIVYANVLDRFYGLSMTDVLEGEQRFQQALVNARIDELALTIHPPTVHRRGMNVPEHQMRQVPGALVGAEDPTKHLVRLFPQGATQQAYIEQTASELRAQKITGLNDQIASGVATGNNPAARTATGAGAQAQAGLSRIQYFVENVETMVFQPILRDIHEMNKLFLDPNQVINSVNGEEIDPITVFGAEVNFKMRASTRMASKMAIMQVFPQILQSLMNPALVAELALNGLKPNIQGATEVMLKASGYAERVDLITALTQEEMQARQQQQQQQADGGKQALQDSRMRDLAQLEDQKTENKLELQGDKFEKDLAAKLLTGEQSEKSQISIERAKAVFTPKNDRTGNV